MAQRLRAVGLRLITGAADDDCSAMGTCTSAGAKYGPALLWTAPVTFPMMFTVVYLSAKLGALTGVTRPRRWRNTPGDETFPAVPADGCGLVFVRDFSSVHLVTLAAAATPP